MRSVRVIALLAAAALCALACTLNPQPYPPGDGLGAAADASDKGAEGGVTTPPQGDAGAGADAGADADADAGADADADADGGADGGADAEPDARDAGSAD